MKEIILVNVVGNDRPGLTALLTDILARYEAEVLDIGQAVIHDHLSLGMLIDLPDGEKSYQVLKELLFKAHELGLNIRFTPITVDEYGKWVAAQGQERHVVTMLAPRITAKHLARLSEIIASNGLNIEQIARLSGRIPLDDDAPQVASCMEFSLIGTPQDKERMRADFVVMARTMEVDIAFQAEGMFRRNRRLVVFDMDSTLIQQEVIDELAVEAGVGDQVKEITEAAMRGELDFKGSFTRRLALLEGLSQEKLDVVASRLVLTDGAERLIRTLKRLGYKTAILSGGFGYFGKILQEQLGIDYVFANELEIVNGRVTGRVSGEIVDGQRKADLLRLLAQTERLSLEQVVAVGDGANDLPMLALAGLGIAFHAKPLVKERARQAISFHGLDGVLYLLGVRDRELATL
jgi:phosphoserine phosphatase